MKKNIFQLTNKILTEMPLGSFSVKTWMELKDKMMLDEVFDRMQEWERNDLSLIEQERYETMKENQRGFVESFPQELKTEMRIRYLKSQIEPLIKELKDLYQSIKAIPELIVMRENLAQNCLRQLKRYKTELSILEHNDEFSQFPEDVIAEAGQKNIFELYDGKMSKIGGLHKTNCIFHKEKTPSLTFFPREGYYCFGCNKGGDAISFVQNWKQLSFQDAIKFLLPYTMTQKPKSNISNFNPIPKIQINQIDNNDDQKEDIEQELPSEELLEEFDENQVPW